MVLDVVHRSRILNARRTARYTARIAFPNWRHALPRVSVLMPMKNAEPYVRRAARSVLDQDCSDLELIVVDDGSTDRSVVEVEALRDSRVRILSGPCRGVSASWNLAFTQSTGAIVMQCDADDLYPPDRIAWQLRFLDSHPEFGAVCGGFATMAPSGEPIANLWQPTSTGTELTQELLAGKTRAHLCAYAARREALESIGGKREYFTSAEDIDLQLRLAEVCRVWFEPRLAYMYRLHDSSLTHTQASNQRRFYEDYARQLRAQRAAGRIDDLEAGAPLTPPSAAAAPDGARKHLQGILTGEAWRKHRLGHRSEAVRLGLRALRMAPGSFSAWRSLAALFLKGTRACQ